MDLISRVRIEHGIGSSSTRTRLRYLNCIHIPYSMFLEEDTAISKAESPKALSLRFPKMPGFAMMPFILRTKTR